MELNARKSKGLRPSELKSLQKSRKGTTRLTGLRLAGDPIQAISEIAVDEDIENINPIPNVCKKEQEFTNKFITRKEPIEEIKLDWSLKRKVTFSTDASMSLIQAWLGKNQMKTLPSGSANSKIRYDCMEDVWDCLGHYRFPHPTIPEGLLRKISTGLSSDENAASMAKYWQSLLGTWRPALLSLYEGLRRSTSAYFYYFQHDFGALLRHHPDGTLDAVLCGCGDGIRLALKKEGISFEELEAASIGVDPIEEPESEREEQENSMAMDEDLMEEESMEEEEEDCSREQIRIEVMERLKRRKLTKIKRRTQHHSRTLLTRDVHGLVDFILNQRDGRSYVLLPDLVAPFPFLHGAYQRTGLLLHPPDAQYGRSRLVLGGGAGDGDGTVLPDAVAKVRLALGNMLGGQAVHISIEADPRAIALTSIPLKQ